MNETVQNYAIFVDSSADLTPDLLSDGKLQMVAMSYTNGAENCELAEIASDSLMKSFYDGQRKGNLTRTSQVSPQQFIDAFGLLGGGKFLGLGRKGLLHDRCGSGFTDGTGAGGELPSRCAERKGCDDDQCVKLSHNN